MPSVSPKRCPWRREFVEAGLITAQETSSEVCRRTAASGGHRAGTKPEGQRREKLKTEER